MKIVYYSYLYDIVINNSKSLIDNIKRLVVNKGKFIL